MKSILKMKKKIIFVICILVLSIYSIKSMQYLLTWSKDKTEKDKEYQLLLDKKNEMDKEIKVFSIKVSGLRESSLNHDILETQAKSVLNMMKSGEIVIVD